VVIPDQIVSCVVVRRVVIPDQIVSCVVRSVLITDFVVHFTVVGNVLINQRSSSEFLLYCIGYFDFQVKFSCCIVCRILLLSYSCFVECRFVTTFISEF
jgi:hypothetical protein